MKCERRILMKQRGGAALFQVAGGEEGGQAVHARSVVQRSGSCGTLDGEMNEVEHTKMDQ